MKRCAICTLRIDDNESDVCEKCQQVNRALIDLDDILCQAVNDGALLVALVPLIQDWRNTSKETEGDSDDTA